MSPVEAVSVRGFQPAQIHMCVDDFDKGVLRESSPAFLLHVVISEDGWARGAALLDYLKGDEARILGVVNELQAVPLAVQVVELLQR